MIRDNIVDLLIYSTARLISANSEKAAYGTGFFMLYDVDPNQNYLALVTNKHVVKEYTKARIDLVSDDALKLGALSAVGFREGFSGYLPGRLRLA